MELKNLLTFKVVAELKGITRAAEHLGYAQSSVTAQIQALEEELGAPLFDRLGKKIALTVAGERLLPYAVRMLETHEEAKEAVRSQSIPGGTLMIGTPESLASFRLPAIIQEYKQTFPQVKIILKPGYCWEMRQLVRKGELDMAFLMEPDVSEESDIHLESLITERMGIIAPADHPLTRLERVEAEHFKQETLLFTEMGCSYRTIFEQYLRTNGIQADSAIEFSSIESIKNCTYAGVGIAYLPLITVRKEIAEGKLAMLNWDDRPYRVTTKLAYHRRKWISPALNEWIGFVRKHAEKWRKKQEEYVN
ncbi:LysR family transcriptional regulator [Paenactinomyces guangxiensis]|uniref:LysR family transcriptional regulator n=1 Tax=Paenactinomyces guangxiensis TaxID=1490290 RepID=A0A7W1WTE3_9BACL|nr:LysR family transcriptional regulator [Paenactinomyces guangxiensis]MBA4495730.1 LysR family transcriptional regulator [Paenactinomyces guangxiensis]MBH8592719.1 LysR family transcriptional regulator [Paenactinomyces guangxiensis]